MVSNSFSGNFEPGTDGISRQYLELYNRGITINFDPRGTARTFNFVHLMNILVQVLFIDCTINRRYQCT
jgi:hypothetical protein